MVELGIHHLVTDISSVSGGSIAAGAIMLGLSERQFNTVADFDECVTKRVISARQVIKILGLKDISTWMKPNI